MAEETPLEPQESTGESPERKKYHIKRDKYGMTRQQKLGVEKWKVNGQNAAEAFAEAGFGNGDLRIARIRGSEILNKPGVQQYLREWEEEQQAKMQAETQAILDDLRDAIRIAKAERPVPGTDGSVHRYDVQNLLKASEMLGKYYAMWTDRQQVVQIADEQIVRDVQFILSKRFDPDTVIEVLDELEKRINARRV